MSIAFLRPAALVGLTAVALGGCSLTQADDRGGDDSVSVTSSADACELSPREARAGSVSFTVRNTGSQVTEFYLYAADGKRVIGEVEDIGPGLSRRLVVRLAPGRYQASCRPGMQGHGIRSDLAVTARG